ncbi:hypothetical protein HDU82_008962 [Entophlyctis luteolus]|nr:hypothetical protein HDU82_008962 [Entophlyctis luteolus]
MQIIERLYNAASTDFENGHFERAASTFRTLKSAVPEWSDIYFHIAKAEMFNKRIDKAFLVLDEGSQRFMDSGEFYLEYCSITAGMLLHQSDFSRVQRFKAPNELAAICEKAVTLNPRNHLALHTLATLQMLLGNYREAIVVFEDCLQRFSSSLSLKELHETKANLVEALVRAGEYDRAFKMARTLEAEDPSNPFHVHKIAYVRTIGWPIDELAWSYTNLSLHMIVDRLSIRNPEVCPSGKWRLALNYTLEAADHPERISLVQLNPESAHSVYGRNDDPVFVGNPLPKYPRLFIERNIHLVYMGTAFMSGRSGIVHGNCTIYTGGHHVTIDIQSFADADEAIIVQVNDPVVRVIQHQTRNYYHWMLEALPKLLLLKKHVLDLPGNENIKILVPEHGAASFIDATLRMDEFKDLQGRFIEYTRGSTSRYWFKGGLWQVDWIHDIDDEFGTLSGNIWAAYWPPREVHHLVREFFYGALKKRGAFPQLPSTVEIPTEGAVVYVARGGGVARGFANEDDIVQHLSRHFGQRLVVHTGREQLLDQVAMFARARVVVGGHGAGMMNYVFCREGAAMVLVPMDPLIAMGGKHYVVTEIPGASYYSTYPALDENQMDLLVHTIQRALDDVLNV